METNNQQGKNYTEITDVIQLPEEQVYKTGLIGSVVERYRLIGTTGNEKLDKYLRQYNIISQGNPINGEHDQIKSTIDTVFSLGDKLIINIFTCTEEALNLEELKPYILILAAQGEILKNMGSVVDSALITVLVDEPQHIQTYHITKEELNDVYKDFFQLLHEYRQTIT